MIAFNKLLATSDTTEASSKPSSLADISLHGDRSIIDLRDTYIGISQFTTPMNTDFSTALFIRDGESLPIRPQQNNLNQDIFNPIFVSPNSSHHDLVDMNTPMSVERNLNLIKDLLDSDQRDHLMAVHCHYLKNISDKWSARIVSDEYLICGFKNGFQVVFYEKPGRNITISLDVEAGASCEPRGQEGAAHLIEHLSCKTASGEFHPSYNYFANNGFQTSVKTTPQVISFSATHGDPDRIVDSVRHLNELYENRDFSHRVLANEKITIFKEIRSYHRSYAGFDSDVMRELFPKGGVVNAAVGNTNAVKNMKVADLLEYKNKFFTPDASKLIVFGTLSAEEKEEVLNEVAETFGKQPAVRKSGPLGQRQSYTTIWDDKAFASLDSSERVKIKQVESSKILGTICLPAPSIGDCRYSAVLVAKKMLFENLNSLALQELREQKRILYSIPTSERDVFGFGLMSIYFEVEHPEDYNEVVKSVFRQAARIDLENGVDLNIFEGAKKLLLTELNCMQDNSRPHLEFVREQIFSKNWGSVRELRNQIEDLQASDIVDVVRQMIDPDRAVLCALGPITLKDIILPTAENVRAETLRAVNHDKYTYRAKTA